MKANLLLIALVIVVSSCSRNDSGQIAAAKAAEARLAAVFPDLGPLVDPSISKSEFIDGNMRDEVSGSHVRKGLMSKDDPEAILCNLESMAAAAKRFTANRNLTDKQRMILGCVFFDPGFAAEDFHEFCHELPPKDAECLTTNDLAELRLILKDEGEKRGMTWDDKKKFAWKK